MIYWMESVWRMKKDVRQAIEMMVEQSGLSASNFCKESGISNSALVKYLNGERSRCSIDMFYRMCRAMGYSIVMVPDAYAGILNDSIVTVVPNEAWRDDEELK